MNSTLTPEGVKGMPYNALIALAQENGIKYTSQPKNELQGLVISKLFSAGAGPLVNGSGAKEEKKADEGSSEASTDNSVPPAAEKKVPVKKSSPKKKAAEKKKVSAKKKESKKVAAPKKVKAKKSVEPLVLTKEQQKIIDDKDTSKSQKMRLLWKQKMTPADIARIMKSHYSFVYGVIDRFKDAHLTPPAVK